MPRRKRRSTMSATVQLHQQQQPQPAMSSSPRPDEMDDAVVFKVNGSPIVSPRSIRNSLVETDFDMDGNVRTRKGSVSIGIPSSSRERHAEPAESRNSSRSSSATTTDEDSARSPQMGPTRPPGEEDNASSMTDCKASGQTQEGLKTEDPGHLAGLTGAQLWVHRVLSTHHHTLNALGLERKDFPNTKLSLKQLEILLRPVISLCNMMTPAQFGIQAPPPSIAKTMTEVHYWKLWESDTIDMGIFFMPPNSVIPLHNHPGMSVVTRVLYGSAKVTSFDLVPKTQLKQIADHELETDRDDVKWARVSREGEYVGESTMWLDPRRFNLHQIQASPDIGCALLDIMIPPYDNADRDCHHFKIIAERVLANATQRIVKMIESVTPDNHNEPTSMETAKAMNVE